ncbi:arginyltransferase [Gammaproteobacteria bacterium AS21]
MSKLENIRFFSTPEHPCSYLDNQSAKTIFVDPEQVIDSSLYLQLSELGFRRSGSHVYRPYCDDCQSCVSIRIPTKHYELTSSQKRIYNKNKDLVITQTNTKFSDEYYQLYEQYINVRHSDGDMFPPSKEQFESFLVSSDQKSSFYEFRLPCGKLIAVALVDLIDNGMSAVYSFYDPNEVKRSLGTYAILWQIKENTKQELKYLYLGYWVKNCQKMNYKINFKPVELLINGRWMLSN